MTRWNRRILPVLALGAALISSACTPHPPGVTFYGNYTALEVTPKQSCTIEFLGNTMDCAASGEAGQIGLLPGQPLHISVDPSTAETAWRVTYALADIETDELIIARSPALENGELTFQIRPEPGQQIARAEVEATGFIKLDPEAGTSHQVYRIWVFENPDAPGA